MKPKVEQAAEQARKDQDHRKVAAAFSPGFWPSRARGIRKTAQAARVRQAADAPVRPPSADRNGCITRNTPIARISRQASAAARSTRWLSALFRRRLFGPTA